jgi:hypothetical protein
MSLSASNREIIEKAVKAIHDRSFFAQYAESPKAYGEEASAQGLKLYNEQLDKKFEQLHQQHPTAWVGEESSPYTLKPLGVTYPCFEVDTLIVRAGRAFDEWRKVPVNTDRCAGAREEPLL